MSKRIIAAAAATAGALTAIKVIKNRLDTATAEKVNGAGQTVLITGGSGGIGREIAEIFALHGFDLVLAARSEEKLQKAADELSQKYNSNVKAISVDLSKENGAKQLYDEICRQGITINQFVNNAGAGKSSNLIDTDDKTLNDLITLNVTSVTLLAKYIAADMVKNGGGRILNIASLSGYLPDPGLNVYGPTKAYERYLGEALYGELSGSGVSVSTLCPGPVKTNWSKNAGRKDSAVSLDAKEVALAAFNGMQNGDLIIVPGEKFKFLRIGAGFVPTTLKIKMLYRFQKALKEQ